MVAASLLSSSASAFKSAMLKAIEKENPVLAGNSEYPESSLYRCSCKMEHRTQDQERKVDSDCLGTRSSRNCYQVA